MNGSQEEAVFDAARNLTNPAERSAFIERACADDTQLRARVIELLDAQAEAEKFFSESARALAFHSIEPPPPTGHLPDAPDSRSEPGADEQVGKRIGNCKLLQKIGEGGCGVVYMAEQEQPVRRRVALKIIKLGMDTRAVIARFEAERQALAMMDHPHIARVLDAGATETGRPYFVMDLVRGFKITDYCDQNHLDTTQRLDLFIQICHAIQHAHQKGIIHRDIKPSNILVTLHDGVPVPKVIDFGIAKATEARLTDKTLFTAYEQLIGTPAYMSPEQAEMSGLDIDTRSDIYSLGVLLYELLTGKTPFDSRELLRSGLDEMRRTLREREPHRPSIKLHTLQGDDLTATAERRHAAPPKLISQLRGDLDWIVMKALEKDRRRRYETANGLAMDIQRHVNNEPVTARPPSRLYRFQKLVRRNRAVFAGAGAVAAALVIGLGVSTWLFVKERQARHRAVAAEQQQARLRNEAERARANEAELRRQAERREKISQATLLVNQERHEEADQLMAEFKMAGPMLEGAAVFRSLGEWHAVAGRWKLAAERFAVLLRIDDLDGWDVMTLDYLERGPVLIELGDVDSYERFRQEAIERFATTANPVVAERIIKVSLLQPAEGKLLDLLPPLAEVANRSFLGNEERTSHLFRSAWRAVSLALLHYRTGNYSEAMQWARQCLACPEYNPPRNATAHILLALATQKLGEAGKASLELAQGRDLIETEFRRGLGRGSPETGFWFDWVIARILLREGEALCTGPAHAANP